MRRIFNTQKAQQLVEFVLVLPILIIVLMVVIEIGFAINARISLAEATKMSISVASKENSDYDSEGNLFADSSKKKEYIRDKIKEEIWNYFDDHGIPLYEDKLGKKNITVKITRLPNSETAVVVASYRYFPAFHLLNGLGGTVIPNSYLLTSSHLISSELIELSRYSSLITDDLAHIDRESADSRRSVLKTDPLSGISSDNVRKTIAFLIKFTDSSIPSAKFARLFNWWGQDLLPPNLAIEIEKGTLYVKTPYANSGNWFDTRIPYTWVLTNLGFTTAIYTEPADNKQMQNYKLDLASNDGSLNLGIPWCRQGNCDGDLTGSNTLLSKSFGFLFDNDTRRKGSFDIIKSGSSEVDGIIRNINIYNSSHNYLLKLYVPYSPEAIVNDGYKGYRYFFGLVNSAYSSAAAKNTYIYNCYLDNDGDGIPNAWDGDPLMIDADGNGTIDGTQKTISRVNTSPSSCALSNTIILLNPPVRFDGSGSVNNSGKTYIPVNTSVRLYKTPFSSHPNALGFSFNGGLTCTRYAPTPTFMQNFVNNTSSSNSAEVNLLNAGAFKGDNKE